jgi:hypothetical protein
VHSRPWNHIDNLEIIYKKRNYNDCHIMPSGIVALKGTNLAMEYGGLTMSEATT